MNTTFIWEVWSGGGPLMVPLFLLAALIFYSFCELALFFLFGTEVGRVPHAKWDRWIDSPAEGKGEMGEIIRYCLTDATDVGEVQSRFAEVRFGQLPRLDRRIFFLGILVSLSPLLGLLGTVTGMLATFQGLSGGGGRIIDGVASGISEALITTQVGLTIAVPGYIMVYFLVGRRQQLAAHLAHLETKLVQAFTETQPQ